MTTGAAAVAAHVMARTCVIPAIVERAGGVLRAETAGFRSAEQDRVSRNTNTIPVHLTVKTVLFAGTITACPVTPTAKTVNAATMAAMVPVANAGRVRSASATIAR